MKPKVSNPFRSSVLRPLCLGLVVAGTSQIASAVDGIWANPDGLGGTLNWSDTANWDSATVANGTDAVATFPNGSPLSTSAVIVDTNITIGTLSWSNSTGAASDFSLAGSSGNALTFATSVGVPMIDIASANNRLLNLGGSGALNIQGTQGLIIRSSEAGALTGTGLDATSGDPSKQVRVYDLDYTGFSGGITVDRGSVGLKNANQLGSGATTQGLTVGTADTITFNSLALVALDQNTQVTTLNGNSLGRITGSTGKVLTVGVNDATGGNFGGVFGVGFGGNVAQLDLLKTGTGTQTVSGRVKTLGEVTVDAGTLILSGTGNSINALNGAAAGTIEIASGADLTITNNNKAFNGIIAGSGSLTINGAGETQTFTNNSSSFTGATTIIAGTLSINGGAAAGNALAGATNGGAIQLGDASNQDAALSLGGRTDLRTSQVITVVGSGARVLVGTHTNSGQIHQAYGITLSNADLTVRSAGVSGWRINTFVNGTGNMRFEGNASGGAIDIRTQLNNFGTVTNAGTGATSLTINGTNGGSIGANVTSIIQDSATSNFIISSANTNFAGSVQVKSGTLQLTNATALNSNNTVSLGTGGILDVQNNVTIAGLNNGTGFGTVRNNAAADYALTLGGSGSYSFGGTLTNGTTNALALTTSGTGTHTLSGDNTYSGLTTIGTGTTIKLGHANALGATTTGTTVNGTLDFNGISLNAAEVLTIGASGASLINNNTSTAVTYATTITNPGGFNVGGAGDLALGTVTRNVSRTMTKIGAGTLTLTSTGSNSRMGLVVNLGNVDLGKTANVNAVASEGLQLNGGGTVKYTGTSTDMIGNAADVQILNGTLDMNGKSDTAGRLTIGDGTNNGVVSGGSGSTYTVNATYNTLGSNTSAGTSTIEAKSGLVDVKLAGTGIVLNKTTAGTVTLTQANTYTGATTITNGTLVINGNISTSSLTTVEANGTLSGSGTVGKTIVNGTLAVGNSPGTMTFTDTLTLAGITVMEIDGTAGAGVTGGHDFINLTGADAAGALAYGGALTLDIGTIFGAGAYSWNLFDMASSSGSFATISLADQYSGSLVNIGGIWDLTSGTESWQFTEATGVLNLTVIPEPSAALLGGLGLLALFRRRRN